MFRISNDSDSTHWATRKIAVVIAAAVIALIVVVGGGLALKHALSLHGVSDEQRASDACRQSVLTRTGITPTTAVFNQVTSVKDPEDALFTVAGVLEDQSVTGTLSRQAFQCTVRPWPGGGFHAETVQIG